MNIYEKLQKCKYDLQNSNIKKTGKNKFVGYDYWELSDFQPTIISLFKDIGLCSIVSFNETLATLTIVNIEKPEEIITITSPMATADLKGCHAIQNLGAVETYSRRYLYMAALDISEPDALDASQGQQGGKLSTLRTTQSEQTNPTEAAGQAITKDQIAILKSTANNAHMNEAQLITSCKKPLDKLTTEEFEKTQKWLLGKVENIIRGIYEGNV